MKLVALGNNFDAGKMVLIGEYNTLAPMQVAGIEVRTNNESAHNASRNKIEVVGHLYMDFACFLLLSSPAWQR